VFPDGEVDKRILFQARDKIVDGAILLNNEMIIPDFVLEYSDGGG